MVERLNGIQEVGSSNLLPSTKSGTKKGRAVDARFFCCPDAGDGTKRWGGVLGKGRNRGAMRAWRGSGKMVLEGGLEPPRVAPHAPQTCVSANSTTRAPG